MVPHWAVRGGRRHARARDGGLGGQRVLTRRPARGVHVHGRSGARQHPVPPRQRAAEALGGNGHRPQLGRDHGAHRARCGLGRRRGPHQGRAAARRHLAPRRRQAVHHERRLRRLVREHHPHGAGAARGGRARHQGAEPVPGPEVHARPGDGRARRAQRRLRHRTRAQDGPQGVGDVRAHLRSARHACRRVAGR